MKRSIVSNKEKEIEIENKKKEEEELKAKNDQEKLDDRLKPGDGLGKIAEVESVKEEDHLKSQLSSQMKKNSIAHVGKDVASPMAPVQNNLKIIQSEQNEEIKENLNADVVNTNQLESMRRGSETVNSQVKNNFLENYKVVKILGKCESTLYQLEDISTNEKFVLRVCRK